MKHYSPKHMGDAAVYFKRNYNLVIETMPVKSIKLKKENFGKGWVAWKKTLKFSQITKKDGKEIKTLVTIQNVSSDTVTLVAVTKAQKKCWRGMTLVADPHQWSFGRVLDCFAQITAKHGIIFPQELRRIK